MKTAAQILQVDNIVSSLPIDQRHDVLDESDTFIQHHFTMQTRSGSARTKRPLATVFFDKVRALNDLQKNFDHNFIGATGLIPQWCSFRCCLTTLVHFLNQLPYSVIADDLHLIDLNGNTLSL